MARQLLRVAFAATSGVLSGTPLAGASRIMVRELADASAEEAQGLQPLRAWAAAAAWHGAMPPPAGLAAPPFGPTLVGDSGTFRQRQVLRNMAVANQGGMTEGNMDKHKRETKENAWPEDAGVAQINVYAEENLDGVLRCSWTPAKGRILRATRNFAVGEVIFEESALHTVQEQARNSAFQRLMELCREHEDAFDYEPLDYWCAIQSLTQEQLKDAHAGCTGTSREIHDKLLLLHHEQGLKEPSRAAEIIVEELTPCADVITIERLLRVWLLNSFEFTEAPLGFSTYFLSSFMSHSCFPNAGWSSSGPDQVLRARREIKAGDEVCISYLDWSSLLQSVPVRRLVLHTSWEFWCDCERCKPGCMDLSRGVECPQCCEGKIFAKTPAAGPAEDASLLPAHWSGVCCDKCGHILPTAHLGKLAEYERTAQEVLDQSSEGTARDVRDLESVAAFIDEHFAQHVLAELVRQQLGLAYAEDGRVDDLTRLLELRAEFHKAAYPSLNEGRALVLEALGDSWAIIAQEGAGKGNGRDQKLARRHYAEALEIFGLIFGKDDVRVKRIEVKLAKLEWAPVNGSWVAWSVAARNVATRSVQRAMQR